MIRPPPTSTLFPYTTLFRSRISTAGNNRSGDLYTKNRSLLPEIAPEPDRTAHTLMCNIFCLLRSEEHTSELQSHHDIVCRLLLEKKKAPGASVIHIDSYAGT